MMCQNYQTPVFKHRNDTELFPTLFPDARYGTYPGNYVEKVSRIVSLYNQGDEVIVVVVTDQLYWPSYGAKRIRFNQVSGAFVSEEDVGVDVGFLYTEDITQSPSGQLYLNTSVGPVYRVDDNYGLQGDPILPATYSRISFDVYMFDELRNRAVLKKQSALNLQIHEFTSGVLLHEIQMPDAPVEIVHVSDTKIYVLMENKAVLGIDYETGQTFSYVKIPQIINPTSLDTKFAWSAPYNRLLVTELTPDNLDGTSTSFVKGFRYVPIGAHVCKPIPLAPLRNGVSSPVLLKQIGDLGEGIAGLISFESAGTVGVIARTQVSLDGGGEGIGAIQGVAAGAEPLTLTSEVTCLL